jgi:hypothetical protein
MSTYICFTKLKHLKFWNGGSIQQRSLSVKPRCQYSINLIYNSLYIMIFYLSEIRSPLLSYLIQSRSEQVLFTCFITKYHLVIKLINHMLASVYDIDIEWTQSISLSHVEGQTPILIHATQEVIFYYLRETSMITLLHCVIWTSRHSFGTR